ncbi:MFS transporter, partial [candidate division KSB1 bacterium]
PIWYAQQHLPLYYGGIAVFIFHFIGGFGGLAGGFLSDKYSPKRIILTSFLLGTIFLVLFTYTAGSVSLLLLGLSGALLYSSIPTVITQAQATMPVHMGTVSSMVMGFTWGIGGLLVMVISRFADVYDVLSVMQVLAYFPLIAACLTLALRIQRAEETKMPEYI